MTPDRAPDPVTIAAEVAQQFDRAGIPYVVGGSFASSLHGEPRSTNDVDIVAQLDVAAAIRFVESLGPEFYVDRDAATDAARAAGSFNIIHIQSAVKIDIFIAGDDALDRERLVRRERVSVRVGSHAVTLWVDTAEDTILRKLEWYRRGGEMSERQWRDVLAVIAVQTRLDWDYLQSWAERIGVADLLSKARSEARAD